MLSVITREVTFCACAYEIPSVMTIKPQINVSAILTIVFFCIRPGKKELIEDGWENNGTLIHTPTTPSKIKEKYKQVLNIFLS